MNNNTSKIELAEGMANQVRLDNLTDDSGHVQTQRSPRDQRKRIHTTPTSEGVALGKISKGKKIKSRRLERERQDGKRDQNGRRKSRKTQTRDALEDAEASMKSVRHTIRVAKLGVTHVKPDESTPITSFESYMRAWNYQAHTGEKYKPSGRKSKPYGTTASRERGALNCGVDEHDIDISIGKELEKLNPHER